MSLDDVPLPARVTPLEQIRLAREILLRESDEVARLAGQLDGRFCEAVNLLFHCQGSVILSGMGKAGLIGRKIMATLASTGTRSHFLHPAEAVHGDLGRLHRSDLVLILSQSGETEEVVRLLPAFGELDVPILAITASHRSTLGRSARVTLELGAIDEACALGLAPSTSTTAMLAMGDALALVTSRMRQFGREDFARFHPAGSLGRKLSKVEHHMRPLSACRVADQRKTVREIFVDLSMPGRRTGAIMLTDPRGRLSGIFTDSDLARLFESREESALDSPITRVMTHEPVSVAAGSNMAGAVTILTARKISELPVVDAQGRPAGLIDVTDVLGLLPNEQEQRRAS